MTASLERMTRGRFGRHAFVLVACLALAPAGAGAQAVSSGAAGVEAAAAERAVIDRYCVTCHSDRLQTGGLSLEGVDPADVAAHAEVWEKVVRKLRAGAMPPRPRPRPDAETHARLLAHIEAALDAAARDNPDPGRTETFRRLNRTEYQNAIRDLLSLEIDVTALLPRDDAAFGFDNVNTGALSPTLLERYLAAARTVSELAVGSRAPAPGSRVVVVPADRTQEDHVDGLPFGTRGGTVVDHVFPVRRRVRNSDPPAAQPQRERRGPDRAARGRADPRRRPPGPVHHGAEHEHGDSGQRDLLRRRGDRQPPERPRAGHGGAAPGGRRVHQEELGPARDDPAALRRPLQHGPPPPAAAGGAHRLDRGALRPHRHRRDAQSRPHLRVPSRRRHGRGGRGVRRRDHRLAGPARLPAPRHLRGHRAAHRVLSRRVRGGRVRGRRRDRPAGAAGEPRVPVPHRARPCRRRARRRVPRRRPRAGVAPVVLPVEQPARRRAARRGGGRPPARARRAAGPGAAHARGPAGRNADDQLRVAVAAPAEPRRGHPPTPAPSPTSTTTCARGSAPRPSCCSGASSTRTAA